MPMATLNPGCGRGSRYLLILIGNWLISYVASIQPKGLRRYKMRIEL